VVLAFESFFLVDGIARTKVLDEGRTDVEVPVPKFPGQTVAGYDLIVETPELFGLKRTIAEIITRKNAKEAITL
jgi:hypothetical protein